MSTLHQLRQRAAYATLLLATILLGLLSRSSLIADPSFIRSYAGDALWSMTLYWFFCLIFAQWASRKIAPITLLASFCVELSQLYQADWINSIRATRIGALTLGHGFLWLDLVCYAAGVATAYAIDLFCIRKQALHTITY